MKRFISRLSVTSIKVRRKAALVLWAMVAAFGLSQMGAVIGKHYQFALNETESLPHWAFVIDRERLQPARGEYFAFVPPANPYYPAGFPFTKRVAGLPGDHVTISGRGYYVNGVYVGDAKPADKAGRPVAMAAGGIIPTDRYFLVTPSKDSLDSRYAVIGLIERKRLVGRAYPVM